jgi:predicted transposase YbfD/YdcC
MASLLDVLDQIPDHRRAQAKQYPLPQVLLFCILGIISGAVSYRKLHTFIRIRFPLLSQAFPSRMRKPSSYTQLREILVGLNKDDFEAAFRHHAGPLVSTTADAAIAADAKALRGSFDAMDGRNAALVLSLFVAGERIILAHRTVDENSNEIPALQALIAELGLQGKLFTADAEHCQKKTFAQTQACGSHLLMQVKDNQPSLVAALAALPQTAAPSDMHETHDQIAHGRQENRRVEVFTAGPALGLPAWSVPRRPVCGSPG